MANRHVTRSRKDPNGNITALCNPAETSWSPRAKADAIRDIETRIHTYYTYVNGHVATVHVVNGRYGKYLSTSPDGTTHNNLDDLPDC